MWYQTAAATITTISNDVLKKSIKSLQLKAYTCLVCPGKLETILFIPRSDFIFAVCFLQWKMFKFSNSSPLQFFQKAFEYIRTFRTKNPREKWILFRSITSFHLKIVALNILDPHFKLVLWSGIGAVVGLSSTICIANFAYYHRNEVLVAMQATATVGAILPVIKLKDTSRSFSTSIFFAFIFIHSHRSFTSCILVDRLGSVCKVYCFSPINTSMNIPMCHQNTRMFATKVWIDSSELRSKIFYCLSGQYFCWARYLCTRIYFYIRKCHFFRWFYREQILRESQDFF